MRHPGYSRREAVTKIQFRVYRLTVWVGRDDHIRADAIELYDHQADPQENVNVAKQPANAALVKQLMEQWRKGWQGAKPPGLL